MQPKRRLSASVDKDLVQAAEAAAKRGDVPTVSAWVNEAMREKLENERRLHALASFIRDFETEHGAITDTEMEVAARHARARSVAVRGLAPKRPSPKVSRRRTG